MAGSYYHGNEPQDSIKGVEFEKLSDYQLLKDFSPRS
jgi:hypothetical protein